MELKAGIDSISTTKNGIRVVVENAGEPLFINRNANEGYILFNRRAYLMLFDRFSVVPMIEYFFLGILNPTLNVSIMNSVFAKAACPVTVVSDEKDLMIAEGEVECVTFSHASYASVQPVAVRVDTSKEKGLSKSTKTEIRLCLPIYDEGDSSVGLPAHWELSSEPIVLKDNMLPVIQEVAKFFSDLIMECAYLTIQNQLQYESELKEPVH